MSITGLLAVNIPTELRAEIHASMSAGVATNRVQFVTAGTLVPAVTGIS
jgi:hypothetical protein